MGVAITALNVWSACLSKRSRTLFLCLQLLHNKCDGAIGSYSGSVQQFVGEKVQGILSSSAGTMHQLLPKYKSV